MVPVIVHHMLASGIVQRLAIPAVRKLDVGPEVFTFVVGRNPGCQYCTYISYCIHRHPAVAPITWATLWRWLHEKVHAVIGKRSLTVICPTLPTLKVDPLLGPVRLVIRRPHRVATDDAQIGREVGSDFSGAKVAVEPVSAALASCHTAVAAGGGHGGGRAVKEEDGAGGWTYVMTPSWGTM